jgi:hypothetical protein
MDGQRMGNGWVNGWVNGWATDEWIAEILWQF